MVVLIVGENRISKILGEKLAGAGHRVLWAADAERLEEILAGEEQIDLFAAAPPFCPDGGAGITSGSDWDRTEKLYRAWVIGFLQALQKAVPYLERGALKRICYLNPACGSINACRDKADYGPHMCAAAINMQINLLHNRLRPLGYTFRLFGIREDDDSERQAAAAYWYFLGNRSIDPDSAKHEDENRLVMRDAEGREIPF